MDVAHAKHRWLSIGTPNIRDLFFVARSKGLLWLVFAASSFPLHTIWNSVVFETKDTNYYFAVRFSEGFLNGAPWSVPDPTSDSVSVDVDKNQTHDIIRDLQQEVMSSRSGNTSTRTE